MSAFYIFDNQHTADFQEFSRYIENAPETVAAFGGTYRAINQEIEILEGDWTPRYIVIIEFPTLEQARAWYHSDAYKELKELRLRVVQGSAVLLNDFPAAS